MTSVCVEGHSQSIKASSPHCFLPHLRLVVKVAIWQLELAWEKTFWVRASQFWQAPLWLHSKAVDSFDARSSEVLSFRTNLVHRKIRQLFADDILLGTPPVSYLMTSRGSQAYQQHFFSWLNIMSPNSHMIILLVPLSSGVRNLCDQKYVWTDTGKV